jgi:hypothetical protein
LAIGLEASGGGSLTQPSNNANTTTATLTIHILERISIFISVPPLYIRLFQILINDFDDYLYRIFTACDSVQSTIGGQLSDILFADIANRKKALFIE